MPFWVRGGRLLAVVLVLGGCAAEKSPPPRGSSVASIGVTGCTPAQSPLVLPGGWPMDLPLPPGIVVTRTEKRIGNRLIIQGFVPDEFRSVLRFMQQRLPAAGYPLGDGEVEPDDAESNFSGHGVDGRWTLRARPDCGKFTQISVAIL